MLHRGFVTGLLLALIPLPACGDDDGDVYNRNDNQSQFVPWECEPDGYCDGVENAHNCPADCRVECPTDLTTLGATRLMIVSDLRIPRDSQTAAAVGSDIDGDGERDNKWGMIHRMADNLLAAGGPETNALYRGDLILPARFWGNPAQEGATVGFQLLPRAAGAPPTFDGTDVITLITDPPTDSVICGRVQDGIFNAGPVDSPMASSWVLNNEWPVVLEVAHHRVSVRAVAMGTSLELTVATALSHAEVTGPGFDRLAAFWETHAALDPEGEFATTWIDLLDGNGDESVPGCDPLPPDCQEDRTVSVNEIRCNHLLYSIFSSDLDLDLDGVKEHLSYGYKATLVPALLGQP